MFFGLGGGATKTIEKPVLGGNMVPVLHGLSGRVDNNAISMEIKNSLMVFFEEMATMAELHASKVVRLQTNIVSRDDNDNDIEIPRKFTKRGMYEQW